MLVSEFYYLKLFFSTKLNLPISSSCILLLFSCFLIDLCYGCMLLGWFIVFFTFVCLWLSSSSNVLTLISTYSSSVLQYWAILKWSWENYFELFLILTLILSKFSSNLTLTLDVWWISDVKSCSIVFDWNMRFQRSFPSRLPNAEQKSVLTLHCS